MVSDNFDDRRYTVPPSKPEDLRAALSAVGIEADVHRDETGQNLITIKTEVFLKRRNWIETWFTPFATRDDSTFLRERPRGTGDTH